MISFSNYNNENSLMLMINEIEQAIESKLYLSALHVALTIPDMLGTLAYPKLQGKQKYAKWFDENVRDIIFGHLHSKNPLGKPGDFPMMNGNVCYALRNKLFHNGENDIESRTEARINEFVLSFTDEVCVRGNYSGKEYDFATPDNETGSPKQIVYLYISCIGLCKEIVNAAKEFYKNNPGLDYPKIKINYSGGRRRNVFWCD